MAKRLTAAAFLAMAAMSGAQAQDYPARTVTVIVPFAAGGPADITGRIVAGEPVASVDQKDGRTIIRDGERVGPHGD